jgi:hypothetical protein
MSQFHVSDPHFLLPAARQRQAIDARRAAEWRLARDFAKSQRTARRAGQPARDEIVQGPAVPVAKGFKIWWRSALHSLRIAG